MKKASILLSLAVVAVMVLAACTGGTNNNQNNTTGTTTPAAVGTTPAAMATTPAAVTGTPAVTGTVSTTGTPAATGTVSATTPAAATNTPSAAAATNTPAASAATATPQANNACTVTASLPVTWDRFSHYVGLTVQDSKGAKVGTMRGLVVMVNGAPTTGMVPQTGSNASNSSSSSSSSSTSATATPSANMTATPSATGTATPQASNNSSTNSSSMGSNTAANTTAVVDRIVYLAVKPDASLKVTGNGDILIPWAAVKVSGSTSSTTTTNTTTTGSNASTSATATPSANATATPSANMTATPSATGTATPQASNNSSNTTTTTTTTTTQQITMIEITVDAQTVAGAPVVPEEQIASGDFSSFISGLSGFWNSQGLSTSRSIPATGANCPTGTTGTNGATSSTANNQVPLFLTSTNYKNMQVVDQSNAVVGKTDEFILDANNGIVQYFVFQGTGSNFAANGKFVIVPLAAASWQKMGNAAGNSAANAGPTYQIVVNIPASGWANVPVIAEWSPTFNVTTTTTWVTTVNSFWTQFFIK